MTPNDRRYTKEHEWALIDQSEAVVGITNYAQEQLGDVVYVELPKVGATVTALTPFGSVDSFKASSALFAPLSGQVVAVNSDLENSPDLVNKDPYGKGWMIRVRLARPSEADSLLTAEAYDEVVRSEASHE